MEVLVVGAGVVGLACGRAIARAGHAVVLAEREKAIGQGISSRNSEVVHAGLYYPEGSLRARHCVAGRHLLAAFCARHGVPHRVCGKLVVASDAREVAKVEGIHRQGLANGVGSLAMLDGADARALEPALACTAALLSGETGIVDGHAFMLALQGDLEDRGGLVALGTPVERLERAGGRWNVRCGGADPGDLAFDAVVIAAGLGAQALARRTDGYPAASVPPLVLAKGNYFACSARPAFSRLIYPAPVEGGLGTHLTLDLAGRMRFGPDVEWIGEEDYRVDPFRVAGIHAAVRRYWPGLPDGSLSPDYAGIRPKLTGPGEPPADFRIDGPEAHGLPGLVALFGIESPGLTAALSIAEAVAARLR